MAYGLPDELEWYSSNDVLRWKYWYKNDDDKGLRSRCRGSDHKRDVVTFFCLCDALQENEQ